jgi:hypothetical protein
MSDLTGKYYFTKTKHGMVLMVERDLVTETCFGGGIDDHHYKAFQKAEEKDIPYIKVMISNGEKT